MGLEDETALDELSDEHTVHPEKENHVPGEGSAGSEGQRRARQTTLQHWLTDRA